MRSRKAPKGNAIYLRAGLAKARYRRKLKELYPDGWSELYLDSPFWQHIEERAKAVVPDDGSYLKLLYADMPLVEHMYGRPR